MGRRGKDSLARMWMGIFQCLLALALVSADGAADVAKEQPAQPDVPGFSGKLPTAEELLNMLDSMTGISEEEKTQLREDLMKNIRQGGTESQAGVLPEILTSQAVILLSLLTLVGLIFVFFVYKLFKCLSEREARKEEKKKNKQLKKKK
ncbi:hypothetical protein KM043_008693 [Ampulex compressa]|nr:hypothetical protein KM043_008693 [Ampulex compressa]